MSDEQFKLYHVHLNWYQRCDFFICCVINYKTKHHIHRTQANMRSKTDWEKQTVKPFVIDITPVTNKGFADFVKKKRYNLLVQTYRITSIRI